MAEAVYSEDRLLELGKDNYAKLVSYCEILEVNGFWNQARQVMKKSSTEVLDLYVQSVLMNLAVHCGNILENQRDFIRVVTNTNPLEVPEDGEIKQAVYDSSKKYYELPPVLLQLCGLYDKKNKEGMTEYFLDAFLNILLCMAYLNDGHDGRVNEFIQKYYDKISNFVVDRTPKEHSAYIVKKLTSDVIECDVEWIHEHKLKEVAVQISVANVKQEIKHVKKSTLNNKAVRSESVTEPEVDKEQARILLEEEEEREAREQFMRVKKRLQEREQAEREAHEARIKALMDELNGLVGLSDVKEEIQSLINLIKIRQLRERMEMPTMDMSYHMVFTGSPGTGKTTVARLVGRIYKELGILSDGKMIETDRSGLVAGYVGQTAMKVHDIVEQAIGGVLFIDEAYALVNPDIPNDFGTEAIDALVKLMEDHRDNLVIIVAGYTEEMKNFLKSNTGLISRFNKFINFPDYSKEELIDIMSVMAQNAGLVVEQEAKENVMQTLNKMKSKEWKDFGNARGIRNMFERIVMNQANRLVLLDEPTREDLMTIIGEDVV